MSLQKLLRKPLSSRIPTLRTQPLFRSPRRFNSSSTDTKTRARIDRVLNRLPRFLRPYTDGLRNAPVSHIVSFLILHEITAIVPLVGLAGAFHYTGYLWAEGGLGRRLSEGKWVSEGMERFGRYFGRKGWFGFSREATPSSQVPGKSVLEDTIGERKEGEGQENLVEETEKRWHVGESGGRILVEVATAYAVTKVLLPVRILVSVWGTPWFARVVLEGVRGIFGRKGP